MQRILKVQYGETFGYKLIVIIKLSQIELLALKEIKNYGIPIFEDIVEKTKTEHKSYLSFLDRSEKIYFYNGYDLVYPFDDHIYSKYLKSTYEKLPDEHHISSSMDYEFYLNPKILNNGIMIVVNSLDRVIELKNQINSIIDHIDEILTELLDIDISPYDVSTKDVFFDSGNVVLNSCNAGDSALAEKVITKMIKEVISEENPKNPLSDQMIVDLLKKQYINITCSAVTKYRKMLGMGSAQERKRLF